MPVNSQQQREQVKKKQAYLKANGVNVKIDGKWGRWQEKQYRRLTTRPKAYVPGILGTMSKWYDEKFGDGTTYQIDPFNNEKITEDTRSDTRRWIDNQMRDPHSVIGWTVQNAAPAAAVAIPLAVGAEYLPTAGTFVKGAASTAFNAARNPEIIVPLVKETAKKAVPFVKDTVVPFLANTAKGIAGATAVNAASKVTTGKTWGEQVAQSTGMSEGLGEFTNPGLVAGPRVYNIGKQVLIPSNRSAHAYVTITPISYESPFRRGANWVKSIFSGKKADIEHPRWDLTKDFDSTLKGRNGIEHFINPKVKNRRELAAMSREDAWRIYNGLPQHHGMFKKVSDGLYSYDMDKVMEVTEGTWMPMEADIDFIGSAGGKVDLTNIPLSENTGIFKMSDLYDLQPFKTRTLSDLYSNFYYKQVSPRIQNFREKLFDANIVGINASYPGHKLVSQLENNTLNKLRYTLPFKKTVKKISDKLVDFEVGQISGGKPFLVETDIPYTRNGLKWSYTPEIVSDYPTVLNNK